MGFLSDLTDIAKEFNGVGDDIKKEFDDIKKDVTSSIDDITQGTKDTTQGVKQKVQGAVGGLGLSGVGKKTPPKLENNNLSNSKRD